MQIRIGVVGDFNAANATHTSLDASLHHAAPDVEVTWVGTERAAAYDLSVFHGIWCAPQSPYVSFDGALAGIRFARENKTPFFGTCAGFQHAVVEWARDVAGVAAAASEEYEPQGQALFISRLHCSLVGQVLAVRVEPGTMAHHLYAGQSPTERYYCNFGLQPDYEPLLQQSGMVFSGRDDSNEVRILELPQTLHPFFMATLFCPQTLSTAERPHPLVAGFVAAAGGSV